MPDIKKILVGGVECAIDASKLEGHTWSDIEGLITAGFTVEAPWIKSDYESTTAPSTAKKATVPAVTIYYNNGASSTTGTYAASDEQAKHHIYLIYHPHTVGVDTYDEYVSVGEGTNARWEKIGNADIDLSGYQQIGKTLTSSAPSQNSTGSAGAQTITSSEAGEQTAVGQATISYDKANATTGSAGEATIQGSNFTFNGNKATITVAAGVTGTSVNDHAAQTLSISGSQVIAAHSHTVNCAKDTVTAITEINGGSFSGATQASFTQGSKATLSYTARANVMCSPTVSVTGVLSWDVVDCDDITSWTANGNDTFTPNSVGTFTAASVKTTKTCTYVTSATTSDAGGHTVSGSNFSANLPTLSHTVVQGTISVDINYTPTGSITGSASIASHTHSISYTSTTVTGDVEVAVAGHTHSVTISSHTHDLNNHTHNVVTSNN